MAVLDRMYADRHPALGPAFAQLAAWAGDKKPSQPLKPVSTRSVASYVDFVHTALPTSRSSSVRRSRVASG